MSQTHRPGEFFVADTFGGGTARGGALSPFGPAALAILVTESAAVLKLFQWLFVSTLHKILLIPLNKVCSRPIFCRTTQHMLRFILGLPNSNMFNLKVCGNIGTEPLREATGTVRVAAFVAIAIAAIWTGQRKSPRSSDCCIHQKVHGLAWDFGSRQG